MTSREQQTMARLVAKAKEEERAKRRRSRELQAVCKEQFGMTVTEVREVIAREATMERHMDQIMEFFELETVTEIERFIKIICTDSTRDYYRRQLSRSAAK